MNAGSGPLVVSVLAARPGFALDPVDASAAEQVPLDGDGIEALAAGLANARGDLAIWLPNGDRLAPGAIGRLVAAASARPEVALVYPAYARLDGTGEEVEVVVPEELSFSEMLMFQHAPVGPGAIFRRAAGLAAARSSLGSPPAEFAFWLHLASTGTVVRLLEKLAVRGPDSTSPELPPRELARERLAVLDRILAAVDLPAGSEAVLRSAARSACVLAALDFAPDGFDPEERFSVVDRMRLEEECGGGDADSELAWLEAREVVIGQRLSRSRAVLPALGEALDRVEGRLLAGANERSLRRRIERAVRR